MDLAFKLSSHCKLFRHFYILTFKLFLRSWRQVKMQIAREMLFFFLVSIGTTKIQFFWSSRNFPWERTTWNDLESQGSGRVSRTLLHILVILQYQCGCMVFALFQSVVQSTYWSAHFETAPQAPTTTAVKFTFSMAQGCYLTAHRGSRYFSSFLFLLTIPQPLYCHINPLTYPVLLHYNHNLLPSRLYCMAALYFEVPQCYHSFQSINTFISLR